MNQEVLFGDKQHFLFCNENLKKRIFCSSKLLSNCEFIGEKIR